MNISGVTAALGFSNRTIIEGIPLSSKITTFTGSGPDTWNHDHTVYGVSDLNGLVWEWLAGVRIVNGVLEYIPNNDAALAGCDLSKDSEKWQRITTDQGGKTAVRVNVEGGGITITDKAAGEDYTPDYDGVSWEDLKVDLQEIPQALRYLGILPENGVTKRGPYKQNAIVCCYIFYWEFTDFLRCHCWIW